MNTWIKNNAYNHICNWQFDFYPWHHELTEILHLEETGVHQEATGVHTEETVAHVELTGLHMEFHDGFHLEQEWGWHMKFGEMTELHTKTKKLRSKTKKLRPATSK